LPGDESELVLVAGPLELTVLQPLVEEKESIPLPQESLDSVTASFAEDVQRRSERIHLEVFLYQSGKPIDGLAHIGISASYIYVLGNTDVI